MSPRPLVAVLALVGALLVTPAGHAAVPLPDPSAPLAAPLQPALDQPPETSELVREPEVRGEARWPRTLRAFPGRWRPRADEVRYRWLRDGVPLRGARGRSYRIRPDDVGHRLRVQVRSRAEGRRWQSATSAPTPRVRHRVPTRRVVTYSVQSRGRVGAALPGFRRLARETFEDPRGWRNAGVEFRGVRRGGHFTLVLAEAAWLPRFSPVCSVRWSCRVGRYVIINHTRWQHASPAWNAAGRSLRDYRHLVVNHETGHWLGRGHRGCPGPGDLAPVMMQQSKGTGGCRFNPWPRPDER